MKTDDIYLSIENFPKQQEVFSALDHYNYVIVPKGRRAGFTIGAAHDFIEAGLAGKFKQGLWGDVVNSNIEKYISRLFVPELSKLPRRLWKWDKNPHVISIGNAVIDFRSAERPECHDEQTEILTDKGWKYFGDLDKTEQVLTLNSGNLMAEWQTPYKYISTPYDRDMYQIKSKKLDMLVTPNHRFLFFNHEKKIVKTIAEANKHWAIPASVNWKGIDNKTYTEDLCAVIGFYLAEGWSHINKGGYRVTFAQTEGIKGGLKGNVRSDFITILKRMGFNPIEEATKIHVINKELFELVNPLGQATTKYIPSQIKNLPVNKLKILIDWMIKGDGCLRLKQDRTIKETVYYTTSKQLADDFQEIIVKCGKSGTLSLKSPATYSRLLKDGRIINASTPCYQVRVCNNKRNHLGFGGTNYISQVLYKGNVYCVSTENGYILTRRNGKIAWSGNSWEGFGYDKALLNEAGIILKNLYLYEHAIKPMLWDSNCHIMIGGTPKGKGKFFELHQRGIDPNQKAYTSIRMSPFDNPYINHKRIYEDMKDMSELAIKQEIYGEFLDDSGVVFRGITQITVLNPRDFEAQKPIGDHIYVIGCDLAKLEDFTVIVVYDRTTNNQVFQMRFNKLEWPYIRARIADVSRKYNRALIMLDSTGVGEPIYDDLVRMGLPVEGIKFSNTTKKDLINKLANWVELRHLKMLMLDETIQEFNNFTYDISDKTDRIFYGAPAGLHDDVVIAHALAVWSLQPVLVTKPTKEMTEIEKDMFELTHTPRDQYEEYEDNQYEPLEI